jgi:hypothetical protein
MSGASRFDAIPDIDWQIACNKISLIFVFNSNSLQVIVFRQLSSVAPVIIILFLWAAKHKWL